MSSTTLTTLNTILDSLRPNVADARLRLRHSAFGLVALLLLVNLSPVPGPWTAIDVVWLNAGSGRRRRVADAYSAYGSGERRTSRADVGMGLWSVCAAGASWRVI